MRDVRRKGTSSRSGECQLMLEAICPSEYDLKFNAIESKLSSQHERGRSDCLGEKLEANLANIIFTDEILEQLGVKHEFEWMFQHLELLEK